MLGFFSDILEYFLFYLPLLFNIFKYISNKYNKWKNKIYKYAELFQQKLILFSKELKDYLIIFTNYKNKNLKFISFNLIILILDSDK